MSQGGGRRFIATALMGAMLAASGWAYPGAVSKAPSEVHQPVANRIPRDAGRGVVTSWWSYRGPCWSVAHAKRMSIKRNNKARHKARCAKKGGR